MDGDSEFPSAISTSSVIFRGTVNGFTKHGLHTLSVIEFLEQVARFFSIVLNEPLPDVSVDFVRQANEVG